MIPQPKLEISGIRSMVASQTEGALRKWAEKHKTVTVNVEAGSMGRSLMGVEAGRTADENAAIANIQRSWSRNPFFLDGNAIDEIKRLCQVAAARIEWRRKSLLEMGQVMLEAVRRHQQAEVNKNGLSFKSLSESYAKWKQRRFGFVHPILRATGQLMDTLRVRVQQET